MSLFLRLLEDEDKDAALAAALRAVAAGQPGPRVFEADPEAFALVPGAPCAYWLSPAVQWAFTRLPGFEGEGRTAKGGAFGRFCADLYLRLVWADAGKEIQCFVEAKVGSATRKIQAQPWCIRPGLTWPLRTQSGLSVRAMPTAA